MRLGIGLERYVLVNFIMNCVVIGVIAKFRGRHRWGLTLFVLTFLVDALARGAVAGAVRRGVR